MGQRRSHRGGGGGAGGSSPPQKNIDIKKVHFLLKPLFMKKVQSRPLHPVWTADPLTVITHNNRRII